MNPLQQFVKLKEVKTLTTTKSSNLKGGGIANGKNGCPIGYEPNDPVKFMKKMERQEAKI